MMQVALYSEDRELQQLLTRALGEIYQVYPDYSEEAIQLLLASETCDLVYLDLSSKHHAVQPRINFSRRVILSPVSSIIVVDDSVQDVAVELVQLGADGYHRKDSFIRDLQGTTKAIEELLASKTASEPPARQIEIPVRQNETPTRQIEGTSSRRQMIGQSPRMQQVYDLVDRVANLDASVLITGESGTGKELIAQSIHQHGCRASRPFVAVSCSSIPESLLEAELFGHEKGAFTGTTGIREGYFEKVGTGTLFLDEIGDLSLDAQVKLLRVLQERNFCRLGSSRLIPLQARLIFATHRDLAEMVREGTFRGDLYYRINVMRITAPSLRDHPEDIIALATHFLKYYSQEFNLPVRTFEPEALAALQAYPWPGNVREIENAIQRAIIMASGSTITALDLPLQSTPNNVIGILDFHSSSTFDQNLSSYKVQMAMAALKEFQGNKSLAARSLGISRPYLYRLIRQGEMYGALEMDEQQVETM